MASNGREKRLCRKATTMMIHPIDIPNQEITDYRTVLAVRCGSYDVQLVLGIFDFVSVLVEYSNIWQYHATGT